ncbi:hypothetical protein KKC17_00370 [Patescibacteria group bacterium]|nr:hypothetical protein [Patescibacteria group bacterium]
MRTPTYLRWLVPLVFLLYLAGQNLFSQASLSFDSWLLNRQPAVGILLPAGRVTRVEEGLKVKQEPLYLDIKIPPRAQAVKLKLLVKGQAEVTIGSRQVGEWSWQWWPQTKIEQGDEVIYLIVAEPIGQLAPDYSWRFILSIKDMPAEDLIIKKVQVEIVRNNFSKGWLKSRLFFWL